MEDKELLLAVCAEARAFNLDEDLVCAITETESTMNQFAIRFEPKWEYFVKPEYFAELLGTTVETEKVLQSMSWGPMQVMGSVARELGFVEPLVLLTGAWKGAELGCHKLHKLTEKYPDQNDAISAYNAGSVKKDQDGRYLNQNYVDSVNRKIWALRQAKAK